jgi:hypothetical protein
MLHGTLHSLGVIYGRVCSYNRTTNTHANTNTNVNAITDTNTDINITHDMSTLDDQVQGWTILCTSGYDAANGEYHVNELQLESARLF